MPRPVKQLPLRNRRPTPAPRDVGASPCSPGLIKRGAETLRTPLLPFPRSPFALARAEEAATTAAALAGSAVREQPFPSPRRRVWPSAELCRDVMDLLQPLSSCFFAFNR